MTLEMILAFTGAFVILAVSPGPALVATLSRTLGGGLGPGLAVTTGLVLGDAIFLAIAMVGLSAIASAVGPLFQVLQYGGAAYLIWLGVRGWRRANAPLAVKAEGSRGLGKDFCLGLVVYLGNPKPIIFYGAFLPTILDLSRINLLDFAVLMLVVTTVSFLVYGAYMIIALRAGRLVMSSNTTRWIGQSTSVMLVCSGLFVAIR